MTNAADRLYDEVIRREMGVLASRVQVRIIVSYLPCLTITDREEIEAKRETSGNYCAIILMLDNLRRRENWPEQFITALRQIEQPALANLISDAYNRIRGIHTPSTPAAAASPSPAPCSAECSATVAAPAAAAPPSPAPCSAGCSATVAAPAAAAPPSPAPCSAGCSATVAAPAAAAPPSPAPCSAECSATVAVPAAAAPVPTPFQAFSGPSSNLPTNPTANKVNKPANTSQSSALPQKVSVAASIPSVKHPVQDTNPPETGLVRDSQNNTTMNPVGERVNTSYVPNNQNRVNPSASSGAVAASSSNFANKSEEYFSKPGALQEEEPLSFISYPSLQISNMTADSSSIQSARPCDVPNCGEESANERVPEVRNSSYSHQPEEDHYESFQTNRHIINFSENPSVPNLSGQPLNSVRQTTMDFSAAESPVRSATESIQGIHRNNASQQTNSATSLTTCAQPGLDIIYLSELNTSNQVNIPQSEAREESPGVLQQVQSNLHLISAAAFGIAAVFVALKFKH